MIRCNIIVHTMMCSVLPWKLPFCALCWIWIWNVVDCRRTPNMGYHVDEAQQMHESPLPRDAVIQARYSNYCLALQDCLYVVFLS